MIFLETERMLFRTHEARDEDDFIRMQTDAEVRRYVGGKAWPLEKAQARFREEYLGQPTETYGGWAAILKNEDRYIGFFSLRAGEKGREASIGYYFARPYWGRGLTSEAARAFIDVAFSKLRMTRLVAEVQQGNDVSVHILKKFSFQFVSKEVIAHNGRVLLSYELSRTEWETKAV